VGISWISSDRACQHVQNEIPAETEFESVVSDAASDWEDTVFSKITTTSTNETSLTLLYSSLYFMHLIPTNQTGENPNWESDEPYYQDIFTFWVRISFYQLVVKVLTVCAGHIPLLNSSHANPAADCIRGADPLAD
jgi:putative alpha-1,2-mannosidase